MQREDFNAYEKWTLYNLKNLGISYSPENVVCLTENPIPVFVRFIASLGQKFSFSVRPHDPIPLRCFNMAFDKLLDKTNQYGQKLLLKKDLNNLQDEMMDNSKKLSPENVSPAQHFIRQLSEKTELFLRSNSDIIIAPADKGGKVVIMEKSTYKEKVMDHLKSNIANHTYFHWKGASIENCREILEPSYDRIRLKLNECFAVDRNNNFKDVCIPLKQEPYMIARLFMLVKVHKEGFPVRPIIAAPDCWAKDLSEWILRKLKQISIKFDDFKIKNSEEFVKKYAGTKLHGQDHRLSSWDYDSMFTNVPYPFVKRIIVENYEVISKETSVPANLFIEAISFLMMKYTDKQKDLPWETCYHKYLLRSLRIMQQNEQYRRSEERISHFLGNTLMILEEQ